MLLAVTKLSLKVNTECNIPFPPRPYVMYLKDPIINCYFFFTCISAFMLH